MNIRYLVEKQNSDGNRRWYWQPGRALERRGWSRKRLSDCYEKACVEAEELNAAVDAQRNLGRPASLAAGRMAGSIAGAGVYVIGPADGPVKIGYSRDPAGRLSTLQTSHPEPIAIWLFVQMPEISGADLERHIHQRLGFGRQKLQGEWFQITAVEAVADVCDLIARYQIAPVTDPKLKPKVNASKSKRPTRPPPWGF
jgi:hypothetical protein